MHDFAPLLVGRYPGRQSPQDVTLFKSLGLGIEDIAVAEGRRGEAVGRKLARAIRRLRAASILV